MLLDGYLKGRLPGPSKMLWVEHSHAIRSKEEVAEAAAQHSSDEAARARAHHQLVQQYKHRAQHLASVGAPPLPLLAPLDIEHIKLDIGKGRGLPVVVCRELRGAGTGNGVVMALGKDDGGSDGDGDDDDETPFDKVRNSVCCFILTSLKY